MGLLRRKPKDESAHEDKASPTKLIEQGDALSKDGKYQQALECYGQAAWLDPKDWKAWRGKAESLAMCFRYEPTIESCEQALEINPSDSETWHLKGFAYEMIGRYQEALESCNKGLEIDPNNNVAWVTRGQYLYSLGRLEDAMESFGTALKMDPDSSYAKEVKGKVMQWLQREGGSDELIKEVVAFLQRGNYQDALKSYDEALRVDARDTNTAFNKDYALTHIQNPEKLMEEYAKAQEEIQPQFELEFSQKELKFGAEAWVDLTVENTSDALARDVNCVFPQEVRVKYMDVDPEVMRRDEGSAVADMGCISELKPKAKKTRLISILPMKAGHFPLDMQIKYTDAWGKNHEKTHVMWMNVFKRAEQLPKIPGYTVVWRMSSGESTDVYAAKRQDGATVIIKVLRLAPEQAALAVEFLREVKLWSKLKHPNIVPIQQYGEKPFPWIAMDYMEKGPLKKMMGGISTIESLQIGISLTEALSYAKSVGVTHRSIKPENVLFDRQGVPKLTDWRIKSVIQKVSESGTHTKDISAYTPPERLSADFGSADWRSDIYQLGVLLYEILTGKPPFQGEEEVLSRKIKQEQPQRPSQLKSSVGKHIDEVIMKCLVKEKEARYQDASSLKADLVKLAELYNV